MPMETTSVMRYVSNIDPNDMAEKVRGLDPQTTLVMLPTVAQASTTQRIYRLYNQWNGDHLFTRDSGERADLMGRGWREFFLASSG